MRAAVLAGCFVLASCEYGSAPSAPASSVPAPDPLAVQVAVSVGQTALTNVAGVTMSGPNIELVEFRQGGQPGGPQLVTGRTGPVELAVTLDYAIAERTLEAWHLNVASGGGGNIQALRQTISVQVTGAGGAQAAYTLSRCLPKTMTLTFPAQDVRARAAWTIACEGLTRS